MAGVRVVYSELTPEQAKELAAARKAAADAAKDQPKPEGEGGGGMPPLPPELQGHLVKLHDTLAKRTMPHFEPFSEGWASVADGFARRQARTPHRTPPNPRPALPS